MPLPLKVRMGIRDEWDSPNCELQMALVDVSDTLGTVPVIKPDWSVLVAALEPSYGDNGRIVPGVAGLVTAWVRALAELLADKEHEAWGETLLNKMGGANLSVRLNVSADPESEVTVTKWTEDGFELLLPQKENENPRASLPLHKAALLAVFDEPGADAEEDWSEVVVADQVRAAQAAIADVHATLLAPPAAVSGYIPSVKTYPRPEVLLQRPPYHLIVSWGGTIEIQGSHSPSLEFIAEYLKKWCRTDHSRTDVPPVFKIKLHENQFALGAVYDRITIEPDRYAVTTIPTVLALIENALGYTPISSDVRVWHYRRDTELKA
ncbi:uncharacterized protein LOC62_02G001828 [Vanrija pseudolonga]|uniref:Uncharacterized protein n=1 Tax=Vanrija pseudolonga TaxID=143232 RepID=A0AAF0Y7I3_9TREE|nr:hypothetical protein LOC62_02G001828 [Vanrija pseudolonga]